MIVLSHPMNVTGVFPLDPLPAVLTVTEPVRCHAVDRHFEYVRSICAASLCPKVMHPGTKSGSCTE